MTRKQIIAVVEDDDDIRNLLEDTLTRAGFLVQTHPDGNSFRQALRRGQPDALVLDLMLPDSDGLDICRALRQAPATRVLPILILSAKSEEMDRILGLELGADDYMAKPFSPRELAARIKALLRRGNRSSEPEGPVEIGGEISLDPEAFEVHVAGQKVELTSTEFRILRILSERKGKVYTRDELLDRLWGNEKLVLDRTVDVHVKNLRDKLGQSSRFIRSIRGIGYKIEE
jgi:DNA-binding response OmpR family regulator